MPSIDSNQFITFGAQLEPAYIQVGIVEPAVGLNGFGLAYGAYRAQPVWMPTISDYADAQTAVNQLEVFRALVSTEDAVAVVDQFNINWPTVAVIGLRNARKFFNPYNGLYRLKVDFRLLVYATVPSGGLA
jgi:hypothetical protein